MRTLPSDFNGFRLANSKFGFVITLKGLVSRTSNDNNDVLAYSLPACPTLPAVTTLVVC